MAVTVGEGVASTLRSEEGLIAALQVDCAQGPARVAAQVAAALRAARADVAALAPASAPADVLGPIPVPGGYLYVVDFGATTPPARRAELPGILVRHLEDAGIATADIRLARKMGTRYEILKSFAPTVQGWLVGPGPKPEDVLAAFTLPSLTLPSLTLPSLTLPSLTVPSVEPALAEIATQWLQGRHRQDMELLAVILGVEVPLTPQALRQLPASVLDAGSYLFAALTTDFAATYAAALFGQFYGTGVTLAEAGSPAPGAVSQMRELREIIRTHAQLAELEWAGVSATGPTPRPLIGYASAPSYQLLGPVWYQLLSADQLRQIGRTPPGAVELPSGRIELTVGAPERWLPDHPNREAVEEEARTLLAPRDGDGRARD
jgi:hypothetical protein